MHWGSFWLGVGVTQAFWFIVMAWLIAVGIRHQKMPRNFPEDEE